MKGWGRCKASKGKAIPVMISHSGLTRLECNKLISRVAVRVLNMGGAGRDEIA